MTTQKKEYKKRDTRNSGNFVTAPTKIQKECINFLKSNEISLLVGEAGTGKDFMQLYRALDGLVHKEFEEIVLVKPIVEIGKSMGYLPGEEKDKTAPYEQSFHENIRKILKKEIYEKNRSKIHFEAANFVRGNTFDYSCVIVSEAQNFTLHELITLCTRLGSSSKMYMNGDIQQADIRNSGLRDFIQLCKITNGMDYMELGDEYQMRNPLIVELCRNYRNYLDIKK